MENQSTTMFPFEIEGDLLEYCNYLVGSTQTTWLASKFDAQPHNPSASHEDGNHVANNHNMWFDLNEQLQSDSESDQGVMPTEQVIDPAAGDSYGDQVIEIMAYNEDIELDEYYWTDSEAEEESESPNKIHPDSCQPQKRICKELNNVQRSNVANKLQQLSNQNQLQKGSIKLLADRYNVSRWSISRIWQIVKIQMHCELDIEVQNCKTGKVGRKRCQLDIEKLTNTPFHKRRTMSATARALGIHKSTLTRMVKRGQVKKHNNCVKPYLSDDHKVARVKWVLQSIVPKSIKTIPQFSRMYNIIHIDEKWFCFSKITQRYYLAPSEVGPDRKCKNKRFIKKIMFLAAVARPHIKPGTQEVVWDGKFVDKIAAKKTSVNRVKGTIETKATRSITKEVIKKKLLEELLPAIKAKWPEHATKTIWIQQDNARPHICSADPEFNYEASKDGFDIHLINQPAQSPDLDVLDLGFFRAIQSIKEQMSYKDEDKLIEAVEEAYNSYDPILLNYIFLSLQSCMIEILRCKGNNSYKQTHMDKEALDKEGLLPVRLNIDKELVNQSIWWSEHGTMDEYIAEEDDGDLDTDSEVDFSDDELED